MTGCDIARRRPAIAGYIRIWRCSVTLGVTEQRNFGRRWRRLRSVSRVVVVGLGPAGPELLTAEALTAIERIPHRFLRTTRHPAAVAVPGATSFDGRYEAEATMAAVYGGIVDDLVAAAGEHGEVLYAVPGSPTVAEHTVELLRDDDRVEVEVLASVSFLDLAWGRLGVNPVAVGARLVDGHAFAVGAAGATGPLLVAQCDRASVLSDIKLSVEEGPTVTVLRRLGLPDEAVTEVAWADLDRVVEPDHLTSLWIPGLAAPVAAELMAFAEVVRRLRAECPWDREQTHQSLTRHLIEESYEVLDAIELLGTDEDEGYVALEEELGDLLFQVFFHATLGAEEGRFTLADVARGIHDKLVLRHPHVFAEVEVADADEVVSNWEAIKKVEKGRDSVFDGIPASLPALLFALKVHKKAAAGGLVDPDPRAGRIQVAAAMSQLNGAPGADEVGRALLALTAFARDIGVDPEDALRRATTAWRDALRAAESAG
jgi:tetrapyrrole methylase family protein/MazG family protein